MGMGDVKLALFLGAGLGPSVAVGLMAGMFAAVLPSIVLFVRFGAKARKIAIPFAPFLTLGALIALFFGNAIMHWYLHLR
jgi:leader peptidase (prepilin peptidase)/N-methyltransferase